MNSSTSVCDLVVAVGEGSGSISRSSGRSSGCIIGRCGSSGSSGRSSGRSSVCIIGICGRSGGVVVVAVVVVGAVLSSGNTLYL